MKSTDYQNVRISSVHSVYPCYENEEEKRNNDDGYDKEENSDQKEDGDESSR